MLFLFQIAGFLPIPGPARPDLPAGGLGPYRT
jgi:hypothetical protein